jgi:type VI secretion system VgrG family protein
MPDEIEDLIDDADDAATSGENAGNELGEADQDVRDAKKDYEDDDQSSKDKAKNTADQGTDALGNVGDALDDLGIGDPGLNDLANSIDRGLEDVMGRMAPDSLPPVRHYLYFGKAEPLDSLKNNAIADAVGAADSLVSEALSDVPVLGEFSKDAVSSWGFDDHTIEDGRSSWVIASLMMDEALSEPFRCELVLVRREVRNPQLESQLAARADGPGGLFSSLTKPFEQGKALFESAKKLGEDIADAGEDAIDTIKGFGDDPSSMLDVAGDLANELMGNEGSDGGVEPYINIPLDPAEFLNKTASLLFVRKFDGDDYAYAKRWVTGVISEFNDYGHYRMPAVNRDLRAIRIVIVPSLQKLALRKNKRIFQNLTALEVIREVFRSAGVYGFLPDLPGVGAATGALGGLAQELGSAIGAASSAVGGALGSGLSNALSGQFIQTIPPPNVTEAEWTPKREYCVQYGESDLQFVRRLLEEEGITFFFESKKGEERIVFVDDPVKLDAAKTVDGRAVPHVWSHEVNRAVPVESIDDIAQFTRLHTNKITLRDFNHSDPTHATRTLEAKDTGRLNMSAEEFAAYEGADHFQFHYEGEDAEVHYGPYGADGKKGERDYSKVRLDEERANAFLGTASSNLIDMRTGRVVKLNGLRFFQAPDATGSHSLLVRRVIHQARNASANTWLAGVVPGFAGLVRGPAQDVYNNRFEYQWVDPERPLETPYRPRRLTPKPRARGVEVAIVVDRDGDDEPDETIDIDDFAHGRIKVRFPWDRRGESPIGIDIPLIDKGTTAWVRVAQGWAGPDYGTVFVPRAGMEVLVAYENADPDRPYVVGCLYNEDAPPFIDKPEVSAIRTLTNPLDDDETYNELLIDDSHQKEEVRITASKYFLEEVRNEHFTTVGKNQDNLVKRHHGEIIDGKQLMTVEKSRKKSVELDETTEIAGDRWLTITGSQTVIVSFGRQEKIGGTESIAIGAGTGDTRLLSIYGKRETIVGPGPNGKIVDLIDVKETKDDTITGILEVLSPKTSTGAPASSGNAGQATGIEVQGGDDGHAHARSEGDLTMKGKGEIRIISEEDEAVVNAETKVNVKSGGSSIDLADGGLNGATLSLFSDKMVKITCLNTTATFSTTQLMLNIPGKPLARLEFTAGEAKLEGGSLAIVMDGVVDINGGAIKFAD